MDPIDIMKKPITINAFNMLNFFLTTEQIVKNKNRYDVHKAIGSSPWEI